MEPPPNLYFCTCLARMVTMPPPECAAAPLGSIILVHLPSTRGFLPFFCSFTLSQKLPTLLPLCFLGFACHGARRCCHDFQRRVSIQVCVCELDKKTLVLSSGSSYRFRHWRRTSASAGALLCKHVGTLAACRTAAQPHMFISFIIT